MVSARRQAILDNLSSGGANKVHAQATHVEATPEELGSQVSTDE